MMFGQVVIGPPGSGKTTYCNGMSPLLRLIGRKVAVINLDPANDSSRISGGERRRLSNAVELLAQPRVLCLDEATTGLDRAAAFFVVEALRNVARDGGDGRIVVCFPQVLFSKK